MSATPPYSMLSRWSDEDRAYRVQLPRGPGRDPGLITHGDTYKVVVRNGREVLEPLVEVARGRGERLPTPPLPPSGDGAASD